MRFLGCFKLGGAVLSIGHDLSDPKWRVAGLKQVVRLSQQRGLEKVYIAKDADEEIVSRVRRMCEEHGIPCDMSYSMHQIGNACEIEVGSACAGVLKKK
jgi:large subunit ribosomal protein L7A